MSKRKLRDMWVTYRVKRHDGSVSDGRKLIYSDNIHDAAKRAIKSVALQFNVPRRNINIITVDPKDYQKTSA